VYAAPGDIAVVVTVVAVVVYSALCPSVASSGTGLAIAEGALAWVVV
jgi:hypothetical protein